MNNNNKKSPNGLTTGLVLGLIMGLLVAFLYSTFMPAEQATEKQSPEEQKPLYWVAPMDSNYRRDQPGKSPMGMDLIPYYGDSAADDSAAGTVKISPNVINNLGVRTEVAQIKKLTSSIKGVGLVKYDEEKLFHIHPRVEGWIEKLHIKSSGESVVINQPVYDIYSPALVNAQEELLLALTRNNNRLIQAAEERLKSLHFSMAQIEQLKTSKTTQQRVTYYSAHQGVVENLNIRSGFFVKPGDTLMSIGAIQDVWVEVDVLEKQSAKITLNQPASMTLDYVPGRVWQGHVDFIYPTLDAMTRTLKVRLRFNNEDEVLKPNMYAEVIMAAFDNVEALVVPAEAVIRTGGSDRVILALGEGKFKSIKVQLGRHFDGYIEITDGIKAGDVIVTSAQFLIDSESSKTSDFMRMTNQQKQTSGPDHSKMDHSKMDHSKMNHSKMKHGKQKQPKKQQPEVDHSKMTHDESTQESPQ